MNVRMEGTLQKGLACRLLMTWLGAMQQNLVLKSCNGALFVAMCMLRAAV
jgi:hypothetical protein